MPGIPLSYLPNDSFVEKTSDNQKEFLDDQNPKKNRNKRILLAISGLFVILLLLGPLFFEKFFFATSPKHLIHLKPIHPDFIGRTNYLDSLRKICMKRTNNQIPVAVLWGEAGVGKSEIAITFANQNLKNFSSVFWIDSGSEEIYSASYYHLARQLQIPFDQEDSLSEIVQKVHHTLENEKLYQPWLLIFDNAEKELELPCRGKGTVLITTRNHLPWHLFPSLEVTSFSENEAIDLFNAIAQKTDNPKRISLIRELDCFPLALNLAAHYVAETPGMTEEEYLNLISQSKIDLIENMPLDGRYPNHLLASWKINADQLHEKNPDALDWLHFCTYLCPDKIPFSWLEKRLKQKNHTDPFARKMKVNDILRTVVNQGLLRYDKKTRTFSIHRLKREMFKYDKYFDPNIKKDVIALINQRSLSLDVDKLEDWEKLFAWEPHASSLLKMGNLPPLEEAQICTTLGRWEKRLGNYHPSREHFERAIEIRRQHLPSQNFDIANSLNNLGSVWYHLGDYQKALQYHLEALEMRETLYQNQPHRQITRSLNHLGSVWQKLFDYEKARECHVKALEMGKSIGEIDPEVARSISSLGTLCIHFKKFDEALKHYTDAYQMFKTITKKEQTPSHPALALCLNDLGNAWKGLGDNLQAKNHYLSALKMQRELYKNRPHPEITHTLLNLGNINEELNDLSQALLHYKESFESQLKIYSLQTPHPNIAVALNKIVRISMQLKDRVQARKYYEKAVHFLGEHHPTTLQLKEIVLP